MFYFFYKSTRVYRLRDHKVILLVYIIYIRCYLEQSCVVWHASLTEQQRTNLERVQRVALRIILKDQYETYETALDLVELETLECRREQLCLKFALSCLKNENNRTMFPVNKYYKNEKMRNNSLYKEKFVVQNATTSRLVNSAIPYMQKLLNKYSYPN